MQERLGDNGGIRTGGAKQEVRLDPDFRHKVFHQKKQSHLTGGKTQIKPKRIKLVG